MSKHTEGPWAYWSYQRSGRVFAIETADHRHGIAGIRSTDTASSGLSMDEHEANARLIAAAPDLLQACKAAVAGLSWESVAKALGHGDRAKLVAFIQAAINKAEVAA